MIDGVDEGVDDEIDVFDVVIDVVTVKVGVLEEVTVAVGALVPVDVTDSAKTRCEVETSIMARGKSALRVPLPLWREIGVARVSGFSVIFCISSGSSPPFGLGSSLALDEANAEARAFLSHLSRGK